MDKIDIERQLKAATTCYVFKTDDIVIDKDLLTHVVTEIIKEALEERDQLWIKLAGQIQQEGIENFENPMLALAARVELEKRKNDKN